MENVSRSELDWGNRGCAGCGGRKYRVVFVGGLFERCMGGRGQTMKRLGLDMCGVLRTWLWVIWQ